MAQCQRPTKASIILHAAVNLRGSLVDGSPSKSKLITILYACDLKNTKLALKLLTVLASHMLVLSCKVNSYCSKEFHGGERSTGPDVCPFIYFVLTAMLDRKKMACGHCADSMTAGTAARKALCM